MKKSKKEALLETALDVFSEHGFRGTTVRMLSQKSGVNLAGIGYYFGGKDELYKAVIVSIIDDYINLIEPLLDYVNLNIETSNSEQARSILLKFLTGVANSTKSNKLSKFALLAFKEQNNPTKAYKIIYENYTSVMFKTISTCLNKIIPNQTDEYYVILSQMLLSQSLLFLSHKANLKTSLSVDEFTTEHIEIHKSILKKLILDLT